MLPYSKNRESDVGHDFLDWWATSISGMQRPNMSYNLTLSPESRRHSASCSRPTLQFDSLKDEGGCLWVRRGRLGPDCYSDCICVYGFIRAGVRRDTSHRVKKLMSAHRQRLLSLVNRYVEHLAILLSELSMDGSYIMSSELAVPKPAKSNSFTSINCCIKTAWWSSVQVSTSSGKPSNVPSFAARLECESRIRRWRCE